METDMITYLLILFALIVLIYIKRNDIKRYFDKEKADIKELNDNDDEMEMMIQHYSIFRTTDLIDMMNRGELNEKELIAIKKIIADRQLPPSDSD